MSYRHIRTKNKRAKDRSEVARLDSLGYTQVQIAEKLGVSQKTVSNDLKFLRAEWLKSGLTDTDAAIKAEIESLKDVEAEAWKAWRRSVGKRRTATVRSRAGQGDTVTEKIVQETENPGDSRFLTVIENCSRDRARLMGLEKLNINADVDVAVKHYVIALPGVEQETAEVIPNGKPKQLNGKTTTRANGKADGVVKLDSGRLSGKTITQKKNGQANGNGIVKLE